MLTDILEILINLDTVVSNNEIDAFASVPKTAPANPPLKSMIEEPTLTAGSLKPNPDFSTKISVMPPFVTLPTKATASIGVFAVGFNPPTILTGSPG